MKRSNLDKAYDHIIGIQRNYPDWPSTFGGCSTDGCEGSARGCGLCADCHEKELAEYVGSELAHKFHSAIKLRMEVYGEIYDAIENR